MLFGLFGPKIPIMTYPHSKCGFLGMLEECGPRQTHYELLRYRAHIDALQSDHSISTGIPMKLSVNFKLYVLPKFHVTVPLHLISRG
jgi:hypothetical protein